MHGMHVEAPGTDRAAAGVVIGVGWAHQPAHLHGLTARTIAWLADVPGAPFGWQVDTVTSTLVIQGTRGDVDRAMSALWARFSKMPGSQPDQSLKPPRSLDEFPLYVRYGHQSFGLAGTLRYGLRNGSPGQMQAMLDRLGDHDVATFGINTEPRSDEFRLSDRPPISPPSIEPVTPPPGLVANDEALWLSWISRGGPSDDMVDAALYRAVAQGVPDVGPGQPGMTVSTRVLGIGGYHRTAFCMLGPASPEVIAAVHDGIVRISSEGPTEPELLRAIEDVAEPAHHDMLAVVIREASRAVAPATVHAPPPGEPAVPLDASIQRVRDGVAERLGTLLVGAPEDSALAKLVPVVPRAVDRTELPGKVHHPAFGVAQFGLKRHRLIIGDEGIAWDRPTEPVTVATGDVVAVDAWPDGERTITSRRGYLLTIDPLVWNKGTEAIAAVDRTFGSLITTRDQRRPPSREIVLAAASTTGRAFWVWFAVVLLAVLGLVMTLVAILGDAPTKDRIFQLAIGLMLLGLTFVLVLEVRRGRRWKRRVKPDP